MHGPRLWGIAGALALWSMTDLPIYAAPVILYIVIWGLQNYVRGARGRSSARWAAAAVILAAGVAAVRYADTVPSTEQLAGLDVVLSDRRRVQNEPVLAPPVLSTDRPQTFFIRATDASAIHLSFAGLTIVTTALGDGLFRWDFDPRRDVMPSDGEIAIDVDGRVHRRQLFVSRPRRHPRYPCTGADLVAVVSEETDELFTWRGGAWTTVPTDDGPTDCLILDDGRIVVSHRYNRHLRIGDRRLDVGTGQTRLAHHKDSLVVASHAASTLTFVDTRTASVTSTVRIPDRPDWIAIAEPYVLATSRELHTVTRFGATGAPHGVLRLDRPAIHLAVSPSMRRAFVIVSDDRLDGVVGTNHGIDEQLLTIDVATWRIVDRASTGTIGASPIGVLAVDDNTVVLTFAGSDDVARLEHGRVTWSRKVEGATPHGVVEYNGDLWIGAPHVGAIVRLPNHDNGEPAWTRFEPDDATLAREDPTAAMARRGERAFYEATRSGLSCATCHLHGESDFARHDIGHDTPRPTLGLAGVWGTAPYLRGASYPEVGTLHDFATSVLGGYKREVLDRPALFEAYLRSRVHHAPAAVIHTEGLLAFRRAGCAACHRPGAWTDLAQVPAFALFPERGVALELLDTPSLRGVSRSAPYLYDGRADTLRSVLFEHNPSETHGHAARLSDDDQRALLDLLEAL